MPRLIQLLFLCFMLCLSPVGVAAQNYTELLREFDSRALTAADKRFLQTSLAFQGHYQGLLDGKWGEKSREAMYSYSKTKFGTAPEDWHMALLAFALFKQFEQEGWEIEYHDSLGTSILVPTKTKIIDPPSENFVNWRHRNSSLKYSAGILNKATAQSVHDYAGRQHQGAGKPYMVRKSKYAVTKSRLQNGSVLYVRSDYINGLWSTIMLSAARRDENILGAVSSSITKGYVPLMRPTVNGRLEAAIVQLIYVFQNEGNSRRNTDQDPTDANLTPQGAQSISTGSGLRVSDDGHVLTNEHVVAGCKKIEVYGISAAVVEVSKEFDLAVLKTSMVSQKPVAVFSTQPAKLNSDITIAGYPYARLLSGLNVTRGAVSSLKGLCAGNQRRCKFLRLCSLATPAGQCYPLLVKLSV